jgi:integration host factor subunit alpha
MSCTEKRIIESIEDSFQFTDTMAMEIVEELLDTIKLTLSSGENVMISGVGTFQVKEKAPRKGRNPATGETMMIPRRKVVTFKCSPKLKARINNGEEV